ncbi:facilitated trehalose transporter Tret1-like [Toxorhynchites rutilus septentrionalis]|uniref:facilitated trehalose transporter Tret1-like n=1 Tax=Toxorhynchites rutilus septentrionalis TaxID=329112 RepID=UPI00247843AF|nr:facilitated trehalose transporter Tret1-like [Toxorhynchites rutilus septentrionalis]
MDNESKKPNHLKQYVAAFIASLGGFATGTMLGWSAPVESRLLAQEEVALTSSQFAWAVSFLNLGGALMSIPVGLAVKPFGARNTLLLFTIPALIGWILIIWFQNVGMLLTGRLFIGFGAASFSMTVPIYIGEIASKEIRGTVGSFFQQMVNLGILYAFSLGMALSVFQLSMLCGMVLIVYGVLFFFMPNTPTHLVLQNNEPEAMATIKWLRGSHVDAMGEIGDIYSEQLLMHSVDADSECRGSVWNSLRKPASIRALIITQGLMFFMMSCGINPILFYATSIFQAANVAIEPEVATIILGGMQILGTLFASLVLDRVGRRVLLLASGVVMFASVLTLGIYLMLLARDPDQVAALGWLPILALSLYVTLFSVGFGPIPFMMLGEIFATNVKGPASALANINSNIFSFTVSQLFPLAREAIGSGLTFVIFAVFCFLAVVFVFIFVPETKGMSLNEIQVMLTRSRGFIVGRINK